MTFTVCPTNIYTIVLWFVLPIGLLYYQFLDELYDRLFDILKVYSF